jgi:curved DNA-binding protein CbpA
MTYYEVLGVSENASSTQIKSAYRKLVKQYHPDTNPSPQASEFIKQINEAYDVLSDSEKRLEYDRRHYKYFEPAVQNDLNETYRREYLRKRATKERERRAEEQRLEELREGFKKQIFGVAKWLALRIHYSCRFRLTGPNLQGDSRRGLAGKSESQDAQGKVQIVYENKIIPVFCS